MSFNLILDLAVDKHHWLPAEMNHYKIKDVLPTIQRSIIICPNRFFQDLSLKD